MLTTLKPKKSRKNTDRPMSRTIFNEDFYEDLAIYQVYLYTENHKDEVKDIVLAKLWSGNPHDSVVNKHRDIPDYINQNKNFGPPKDNPN